MSTRLSTIIFPLKALNFITSAKSPLPSKSTYSWVPRIRTLYFVGTLFYLPQPSWLPAENEQREVRVDEGDSVGGYSRRPEEMSGECKTEAWVVFVLHVDVETERKRNQEQLSSFWFQDLRGWLAFPELRTTRDGVDLCFMLTVFDSFFHSSRFTPSFTTLLSAPRGWYLCLTLVGDFALSLQLGSVNRQREEIKWREESEDWIFIPWGLFLQSFLGLALSHYLSDSPL